MCVCAEYVYACVCMSLSVSLCGNVFSILEWIGVFVCVIIDECGKIKDQVLLIKKGDRILFNKLHI